jgi:hypothetical protein
LASRTVFFGHDPESFICGAAAKKNRKMGYQRGGFLSGFLSFGKNLL